MISLIFDTETTGKMHLDKLYSFPGQPHLVELALELYDHLSSRVVSAFTSIVRPVIPVPEEATKIHGISDDEATRFGLQPNVAAAIFSNFLKIADILVCHNVEFDLGVMLVEFTRLKKPTDLLLQKTTFCTMKKTTPICKLPKTTTYGKDEFKWPSLDEAYKILVDPAGFTGAHRAANDVEATRKLMLALEPMPPDRSTKKKEK